ncbi:semaphorin-4E-like [Pholidichthys leucotaenia]
MHLLLCLSVFWLLPLALMLEEDSSPGPIARRSVPRDRNNARYYQEKGVFNYSTMLLREEENVLVLGAREKVYVLNLTDISQIISSVDWNVTPDKKSDCKNKGKNPETECLNYIRILHKSENEKMYVCGTNAFDPECVLMSYSDGKLTRDENTEDGKGKCPFDPYQRYASIMIEKDLYSATSMNFLGSEPVLMRSGEDSLRTEFKTSWLNEPTFVSMAYMPESENGDGDDNKVYLFFSETAVECDCYNRLVVSRVARVCKGDVGGQRTLQKKWTSFLKARIDCPVLEAQLPFVIQDTYRWCDPTQNWKDCIFYSIFTPQSDTSKMSAVCAYRVSDISRVFAEGKYKIPVTVETSFVKWVMYSGDVPFPRPGACINKEAREEGITDSRGLPDRTLQFVKDRPLMDHIIQPMGAKPQVALEGRVFTRIVVNQVQAADGEKYRVMFIGTAKGTLLKAVNYDGETFIIEEVQLFQPGVPVTILKFSDATGQLYVGSDDEAAQTPLATCERSLTCVDCVLARDPYCGWDITVNKCVFLSERKLIQNVKNGDPSSCPDPEEIEPVNQSTLWGSSLKLDCSLPSKFAETIWERENQRLEASGRFEVQQDGLLIHNASHSDAGQYSCVSVEHSKYRDIVKTYQVTIKTSGEGGQIPIPQGQADGPSVVGLQAFLALFVIAFFALLAWNFYKGHIPLPCITKNKEEPQGIHDQEALNSSVIYHDQQRSVTAEQTPLVRETDNGRGNNNHAGGEGAPSAAEEHNALKANLQYIDDETET